MLCFRCGSHVQDGAEKCWNCGTHLAASKRRGASTSELRTKQRTGSRVFGVVFKVGDLIANRYRVQDIVGSGGAGVVYRAHDQEIDVDVAVKVVNAKLVQTSDEQRLFSRQTKIARKLSHQNVVRIYDEGRDEQRPFFTMQFLEGLSLRKIIDLRKERKQTFSLTEIEPIFNQLCQALDYAHKTTFHGNLKPDNVIVLPDLLKVTDFALLRGLPRKPFLAIQKSRGVNFRYLAPEVRLEVAELSKIVDLYSLGVVLSEMLTGVVYDDAKPEQLSISSSGLDSVVIGIIKRCVARAPKDRYAAAGELYEDLRAVLTKGVVKGAKPIQPVNPSAAAEAPTQRLDISKHGERPLDAKEEKPDAGPPKPVEVAATINVPSREDELPREASGHFAEIDDDMIESAAPDAAKDLEDDSIDGLIDAPPIEGATEDDVASMDDLEEEETQAILDGPPKLPKKDPTQPPPLQSKAAIDPDAPTVAAISGIREISNSAIELISDPRATNVIRVTREEQQEGEPESGTSATGEMAPESPRPVEAPPAPQPRPLAAAPKVESPPAAPEPLAPPAPEPRPVNPTVQPTPLPDSAVPEPAFVQAAQEATKHGRLDGGVDDPPGRPQTHPPPAVPEVVVRGAPAATNAPAAEAAPRQSSRSIVERERKPESPANGAGKKERPMTRPRMVALRPSIPTPQVLDLSPQHQNRMATTAGPMVSGVAAPTPTILPDPSMSTLQGQMPLAPPAQGINKPMLITVVLAVLAVLGAVIVMVKVTSDSQSRLLEMQNQMTQLALASQKKENAATKDADAAGQREAEAARLEKEAEERAAAAKEEKAKAEVEATRAEEKRRRLEAEASAAAGAREREKAEAAARVAARAADERRKAADAAARTERSERQKAERERKRKDREERTRLQAERRAERERESRRRAEAKADRLREERARDAAESARRAEEKRFEAVERKRLALEAKDAERSREADRRRVEEERRQSEEDRRKAEEDRRKAEEDKAKEEAALAAAAAAAAEPGCPKGMVLIKGGSFMMGSPRNNPERNFGDLDYQSKDVSAFCVDYYEYPNGARYKPTAGVTFKMAEARCKKKKKRLCSESEWEKACKGPSGTRYPYGNQWDPNACNTEDDEGNDREVTKTATFRKCRSGHRVYDLSGNVAEWTATKAGSSYVVKGGAADRPGYDGRCAARKKKKSSYTNELLGFRCCVDPR